MCVTPLTRVSGREDALRGWVSGQLLPELLKQRGVMAAWYGEQDAATRASVAADIPRQSDHFLDGVLVVEAVSDGALDALMPLLAWERLKAQGAEPDVSAARMRVCMTVHVPLVHPLYAAKAQGRNRFFSFEMQMDTLEQLRH